MSNVRSDGQFVTPPSSDGTSTGPVAKEDEDYDALFLPKIRVQKFSIDKLADATNIFSEKSIIGVGNYASVFEGTVLDSNDAPKDVAIKFLNFDDDDSRDTKQFLVEALMLPRLEHPNVIHLIGCCIEQDIRILVYERMPLGSLHDHLHDSEVEPLNWNRRMGIAYGIANGLDYLHNKAPHAPIFFRDLKPGNVLLDKDFQPKISDFGLAMYGPNYREDDARLFNDSGFKGTRAYSAPEYLRDRKFTTECDVYSFGVVLLELVTGLMALDKSRRGIDKERLAQWVDYKLENKENAASLIDPRLNGRFREDVFCKIIDVGLRCTKDNPEMRPRIEEMVDAMAEFKSQEYHETMEDADQVPDDAAESNPTSVNPGEGSKARDSNDAVEGRNKGPQSN